MHSKRVSIDNSYSGDHVRDEGAQEFGESVDDHA